MKWIVNSGSSYLNIITVVAVATTVIGVSIPIIAQNKRKTRLDHATEMISSSILLSRQKAVAGDTRYRIDHDEKTFRVYREESEGTWRLDPPKNHYALPDGIRISPDSTPVDRSILIDASGEIDVSGSPIMLRLRDRQGKETEIRISEKGHVQESAKR